MDPQHRLLLEETHSALADAAPSLADISGNLTGVYLGCMYHEYIDVSTEIWQTGMKKDCNS